MTRDEILRSAIWDVAKIRVYSPIFQTEVELRLEHEFAKERAGEVLPESMVGGVNDFLGLDADALPLMMRLFHDHCLECCAATSYGVEVQPGETEAEANLREFGIASAADAFRRADLRFVRVVEQPEGYLRHRYVTLVFYPVWEPEHGCELVLQDGRLLDFCGESITFLRFEP